MKTSPRSRRARAAAMIVLIALTAWIFRGFLLTFLLEPIGWLLWVGWRLLASVDRSLVWLLLIIACSLLLIRLVPQHFLAGPGDDAELGPSLSAGDRLAHWRAASARAAADPAQMRLLRLSLRSMADSVAETTRTPLPDSLSAPLEVSDQDMRGRSIVARVGEWFSRMQRDHRRAREARLIDDLLNWMESAVEIKNG